MICHIKIELQDVTYLNWLLPGNQCQAILLPHIQAILAAYDCSVLDMMLLFRLLFSLRVVYKMLFAILVVWIKVWIESMLFPTNAKLNFKAGTYFSWAMFKKKTIILSALRERFFFLAVYDL